MKLWYIMIYFFTFWRYITFSKLFISFLKSHSLDQWFLVTEITPLGRILENWLPFCGHNIMKGLCWALCIVHCTVGHGFIITESRAQISCIINSNNFLHPFTIRVYWVFQKCSYSVNEEKTLSFFYFSRTFNIICLFRKLCYSWQHPLWD